MAQPYSTGPAYLFVASGIPGIKGGGTPQFLGTALSKPIIEIERAFIPVMNDLRGQVHPFDRMYEGQLGTVTATLTRWNESLYAQIADPVATVYGGAVPGLDANGDIGTLVVTESSSYQLFVIFPYSKFTAFQNQANGKMPPGYRFLAANVIGTETIEPGTAPMTRTLTWQCDGVFDPTKVQFTVFDYNTAAVPTAIN